MSSPGTQQELCTQRPEPASVPDLGRAVILLPSPSGSGHFRCQRLPSWHPRFLTVFEVHPTDSRSSLLVLVWQWFHPVLSSCFCWSPSNQFHPSALWLVAASGNRGAQPFLTWPPPPALPVSLPRSALCSGLVSFLLFALPETLPPSQPFTWLTPAHAQSRMWCDSLLATCSHPHLLTFFSAPLACPLRVAPPFFRFLCPLYSSLPPCSPSSSRSHTPTSSGNNKWHSALNFISSSLVPSLGRISSSLFCRWRDVTSLSYQIPRAMIIKTVYFPTYLMQWVNKCLIPEFSLRVSCDSI